MSNEIKVPDPDPASLNEPSGIAGQLQEAASGPVAYRFKNYNPVLKGGFAWTYTADGSIDGAEPLYAAPPAQQEGVDPWRGLYDPSSMPPSGHHPDLPVWEDDREESIEPLVRAQGFEMSGVSEELPDYDASSDDVDEVIAAWIPEAPDSSYRLAAKHDNEDGEMVAWFVRPIASPGAQGGE